MFTKTVVLITGATHSIGSAFAEYFVERLCENSLLILTSRSQNRVNDLVHTLRKKNDKLPIHAVELDLRHPDKEQFEQILFGVRFLCF